MENRSNRLSLCRGRARSLPDHINHDFRVSDGARTADILNIRQSTVSRRIQLLERRIGVQLFERSRSGARTTLAGESCGRPQSERNISERPSTDLRSPDEVISKSCGLG
ncbi:MULTISPECIES: LysR family transcriptional regulator [unclassified Bradyrhizobium]|uniref:helix-turn-helix domain-containing protein n=1 Tax=unclassified Bradyrhizobium TaxID=2631580 RepID=UPI003391562F